MRMDVDDFRALSADDHLSATRLCSHGLRCEQIASYEREAGERTGGASQKFAAGAHGSPPLLDRERIRRRADGAGNRNRGRDEQKFVDVVGRAVAALLGEIENLSLRQ